MWKKVNKDKLVHKDGHWIELLDGSWKMPMNLNPNFSKDLHPFTVAKLLREGLDFAANSSDRDVLPIGVVSHHSESKDNNIYQTNSAWSKLFAEGLV